MISNSWNELSALGDGSNKENLEDYMERVNAMSSYRHIPNPVLAQWMFLHHDNEWMIKNYAWIDYTKIQFTIQEWNVPKLQNVKAIGAFENSITGIEDEFNSVCALEDDELHWEKHGTLRVPPIILDTSSILKRAPVQAELHLPFQLIEGHSRMRNLLIANYQKLYVAERHEIFLMRCPNP